MFHDTTMKKKEFFCSHVTKMLYLCLKNNILALTKEQLSHEVSFHWFLIISLFMCVFTTEAHCTSHSTLHNTTWTQDEQLLQFDVLKFRLENEYNVEIRLENLPYEHIRWIENKDEIDVTNISGTSDMKKIVDMKGNPLLLFVNEWSVGMTLDRNKGLVLTEFGRN